MSNDSQIRTEAQQLAEVMNTRLKALYSMLNGTASDLTALTTTEKSNLVNAINELKGLIDGIEVGTVTWDSLTGKPSTFPPSTHNHDGEYDPAGSADTVAGVLSSHTGNTSNPHNATKAQVGLGSVENTALSTWTGNTSQSSVGTITTGTWESTAIADAYIASASTWNAKASATIVTDYIGAASTITSSSEVATPNAANGRSQKFPLTENVTTFNVPSNLADGQSMLITVLQDATPRSMSFAAGYTLVGSGVAADIVALTSGQYAWLTISRYGTDYLLAITTEP